MRAPGARGGSTHLGLFTGPTGDGQPPNSLGDATQMLGLGFPPFLIVLKYV